LRVLLDTHCWLWLCASPERFSKTALARLADPVTVRLLSSASVWEIVIKHQLGRLSLPAMPGDFVPSRLATTRTEVLEISARHALRVAELPGHHRDPFDRMLVAQALVEGIPLMTSDRMLARYEFERLRPR
jgi:PIN domain nuclease of toxin-antitoxin system